MAKKTKKIKRVRLNLDLPYPVRDRLVELQKRTGAESLTAVIRQALACYDCLVTQKGKLILRHEDGREETFLIPK